MFLIQYHHIIFSVFKLFSDLFLLFVSSTTLLCLALSTQCSPARKARMGWSAVQGVPSHSCGQTSLNLIVLFRNAQLRLLYASRLHVWSSSPSATRNRDQQIHFAHQLQLFHPTKSSDRCHHGAGATTAQCNCSLELVLALSQLRNTNKVISSEYVLICRINVQNKTFHCTSTTQLLFPISSKIHSNLSEFDLPKLLSWRGGNLLDSSFRGTTSARISGSFLWHLPSSSEQKPWLAT